MESFRRDGDLSAVDAQKRAKFEAFETLAQSNDAPIKPERVVHELSRLLDTDAILVADPGTPCPYFSAYHVVRGTGRRYFSNRAHGALGYALAAAIGAHVGRPNVKTVAVMGDGSFGMCVGDLETVARAHAEAAVAHHRDRLHAWAADMGRSEEHTSELQSRQYLVCRRL